MIKIIDNIKDGDIIVIQFPRGEYRSEELTLISDEIGHILPHNSLLFLPDNFLISIIKKEENEFL